ncbi:MAG: ComEC/Rec2 family competence protein [bacterium]
MSTLLEVTMLPAKEGDCLLITYGHISDKKYILIDGGRKWTYKNSLKVLFEKLKINQLELIVVTHVDRDHIEGIMTLFEDSKLHINVKDVWFNTYDHLKGRAINPPANDEGSFLEPMGAKMGEDLSDLLIKKGWPWNNYFKGNPVEITENMNDNKINIGEVKLTLLSPNREKLKSFIPKWKAECRKAGIVAGIEAEEYGSYPISQFETMGSNRRIDIDKLAETPFENDETDANGSSIAFLFELEDKRILFAGDAHADILKNSLENYKGTKSEKIILNAFKVSHHGSAHNISNDILDMIECDHFLISTNGNYFKHPDPIAVARIIKYGGEGKTLHFNFKTEFTEVWDRELWKKKYHYKTSFPRVDEDGKNTLTLSE